MSRFDTFWNIYALTSTAHSDSQRDARAAWDAAIACALEAVNAQAGAIAKLEAK